MDYAVVMAGGTGKRLWPLSRQKRPKQVLRLINGKTLLRHCFERLFPIFDVRNIMVLTNADYVQTICENLPELPVENVIAEPVVRDTAGAIGLAATILCRSDPDATMAVVTADHIIEPHEVFQQAMKDAVTFINANPESLLTFGIKPTFPSTQFGYIKCLGAEPCSECRNPVYVVEAFKEKPDLETAKKYIQAGNYYWNSGMFVWKARTILANLRKFLPQATEPLTEIAAHWDTPNQNQVLLEWFPKLPKISIDFAVMEKAEKVHAIELSCRWLDLGAFTALADILESDERNNVVVAGCNELLDCTNTIIVTEEQEHMIAGIGLENIVVAHTRDATLVCHADQTHRLKELLEQIEKKGGHKFL